MSGPRPILRPPALRAGDLIGVAAPAGPFDNQRFRTGLTRLQALGFKTIFPEQIFERQGFLAGDDERRAQTLNALLADGEVKAVIGARGGYGSMRILDRINYKRLRDAPKLVIGFSDLTAMLLAMHCRTGLVTFHGPVVSSLAEADQETVAYLGRLLTGETVFPIYLDGMKMIRPGRVTGPLIGGNLTLLTHLLATPWMPATKGAILFLEDTGEAPYRLDRMLTALRLAGIFRDCAGIILGHFLECGPESEIEAVLDRTLGDFSGPVVSGLPVGHGTRNLTLPLGPLAVLDTRAGVLDIGEPYLN